MNYSSGEATSPLRELHGQCVSGAGKPAAVFRAVRLRQHIPRLQFRMTDAARLDIPEQKDFVRVRQEAAPLRKEREQYLTHLLNQGTSPLYVRAVATRLIHINRLLDMSELRAVNTEEVREATRKWLTRHSSPDSISQFATQVVASGRGLQYSS